MPESTWNEWSKYVLKELEKLGIGQEGLKEKLSEVKAEIAALKVKASLWGALGGGLLSALAVIIMVVLK